MEERFYYKDEKNNYYSLKEQNENLIPITEEEWLSHLEEIPIILNNEKQERIRKLNRIAELKRNLVNTDYQAIKYAEGQLTEQEYASMKAQRQLWRDEINQLEEELNQLAF